MIRRLTTGLLFAVAWLLFVCSIAWPAVALVARCISDDRPPEGGFAFSSRQLALLWRSVWLSGAGTLACVIVSLPGAWVLASSRRLAHHPFVRAALTVLLLCPPMVYAFGWERIVPVGLSGYVRCIGIWALWASPIPAVLLSAGWARTGRDAHEAALLVMSSTRAFFRIALPLLQPYVALSALIVFLLLFGDYQVPHACGLLVFSTELLGWARASNHAMDTLWPALPSLAVTSLALTAMLLTCRHCLRDDTSFDRPTNLDTPSRALASVALAWVSVGWLLPVGALAITLTSLSAMVEAFKIYGVDVAWSLAISALAGLAAVGMGWGVAATPRLRWLALAATLLFGALPGALIGESLVIAYNRDALWWVYDHWPIVAMSYLARFGWIGVVIALAAVRQAAPGVVAQARVDGAPWSAIARHVHWPSSWPTLVCGACVVAALSLADVATSAMVRVPSFAPIAHVLMEKFHRFELDMLVSLSLWLVVAALPGALLAGLVLRRTQTA